MLQGVAIVSFGTRSLSDEQPVGECGIQSLILMGLRLCAYF